MRKALSVACLVAALALPGSARAVDPAHMTPSVSAGTVALWPDLDGGEAGRMSVWVWTPPGYSAAAAKGRRFPVLYMHDGQNLFDRKLTNYDQEWQIDEAVTRLVRQGDLRNWIVVGVQSPPKRYSALLAQKIVPLLTPRMQANVRALQQGMDKTDRIAGDAYLRFLVERVKPRVDATYRTLSGPADTAVMGSSMGGLMAFYAMAEYPHVFGQAAAVSMHLAFADPTDKGADHGAMAREATAAFVAYLKSSKMRPGPNRLYIDHGTATLDGSYGPYSAALVPALAAMGWTEGRNFTFRTFKGAEHNETAWAQRVDIPLAFLDAKDP